MFVLLFSIKKKEALLASIKSREKLSCDTTLYGRTLWKDSILTQYACTNAYATLPFQSALLAMFFLQKEDGKKKWAQWHFCSSQLFSLKCQLLLYKRDHKCQGTWSFIKVEEMTKQRLKTYTGKNTTEGGDYF